MTFLETAFVALLAPSGAAGLWIFQKRERADERKEARTESHKQLRRSKAEEVFEELSRLKKAYAERVTFALSLIAQKTVEPKFDTSTGRLEALLSIYFQDHLPLLHKYTDDIRHMELKGGELLVEAIKNGKPQDEQNQINLIMSNELNRRTLRFDQELGQALRGEVLRLWDDPTPALAG